MPLCQLIYFSENELDPQKGSLLSQLADIQNVSMRNNAASNITGALIFDDLWFLQLLEGERAAVLQAFERLKEDERHAHVTLAAMMDIETPLFAKWRMGLITRNATTLPAFAPYLRDGRLQPPSMRGADIRNLIIEVGKIGLSSQPALA
jgi:hypothetical protein